MLNDTVGPFGLAKVKREGDIVDPNDMMWEHDPINGNCQQCKDRYQNWLAQYNKQELSRGINAGTKIQNKLRRDDIQD